MTADATPQIVTIPCLSDNYAFLIIKGRGAILVDVPEAAPILAEIEARGLWVHSVLITHHHPDHVQGLDALLKAHPDGAKVDIYGAKVDAARLPPLDYPMLDGDRFDLAGLEVQVMDVSGHTLGHVAYYMPQLGAAFTADSLMAMGCGRLFEGTPDMMWASLSKLSALPPETMIYSGHEYTEANARFALTIEPGSAALKERVSQIATARAAGVPTVPSRLSEEQATNPFLRAHLQSVKDAIGLPTANDAEAFAEIRARKDRF